MFNHGDMYRDFTYIDDIVTGVCAVLDAPPAANADGVAAAVYNIGNSEPVALADFIGAIERAAGREAVKEFLDMQPGGSTGSAAGIGRITGCRSVFGFLSGFARPQGGMRKP